MQHLIVVANNSHKKHANSICLMMENAAKIRGTGIAKRYPEYIQLKMSEGKAVIALDGDDVIGFCYIEDWEGQKYVANSGLITHPNYRNTGLAKAIKKAIFHLSKEKYPKAKLFGITTSMAVMKINSGLGYKPVTFSELTKDEKFWSGCQSCINYDVLTRTNKSMCLCTAMICEFNNIEKKEKIEKTSWEGFVKFIKLRKIRIEKITKQFPLLKNSKNEQ